MIRHMVFLFGFCPMTDHYLYLHCLQKKPRHKKDSTSGNDMPLCPFDLGVSQQVAKHISRSSLDIDDENTPPKSNLV